jgi:hypothetical protein
MPISYSGIVNYGKATLPSVESWGSNNNILRDPPRSITTRRIDKVTDTSMLDQEIDKSSERVAESIRVYPRGANVMVGVSYNNQGARAGGQQAKLPYRVVRDGAFRPPILRPVNLYPLSRLPRNKTEINPVAYTADFTRKLVCPGTAKDYRSVKNDILHVETEAPKGQPIRQPVEVGVQQNIVDARIQYDTQTGKTQNVARPVEVGVSQNIVDQTLHAEAITSKVQNVDRPVEVGVRQNIQQPVTAEAYSNIRYFKHAKHAEHKKYTKDSVHASTLQYQFTANPSQNRYVVPVQSKIVYNVNPKVQAQAHSNIKGQATKHQRHEYQEVRMKEVLRGGMQVNSSGSGLYNPLTIRPTSTHKYLPQKPQMGGHASNPLIPTITRTINTPTLKSNSYNQLMKKNA